MKPLNTLLNFLLLKQKNTASEVTELITCSLFIRKNISSWSMFTTCFESKVFLENRNNHIFDRVFKSKVDLLHSLSQTSASGVRKKYFLHGI